MGVLTVHLEKICNLRDADGIGKSDPYVKFAVYKEIRFFPDKPYGGQKESSHKNNTLNPVYNETFTFHDLPNLTDMNLHVTVMDDDIGLDDKIGTCTIDLEHLGLTTTPKDVVTVIDKKRFKIFAKEATIHLRLSYSTAGATN